MPQARRTEASEKREPTREQAYEGAERATKGVAELPIDLDDIADRLKATVKGSLERLDPEVLALGQNVMAVIAGVAAPLRRSWRTQRGLVGGGVAALAAGAILLIAAIARDQTKLD